MKSWKTIVKQERILLPAAALLVVLLIWEGIVRWADVEPYLLPSPLAVLQAMWRARELLYDHARYTMGTTLAGFSLAALVGVMIAAVMDVSARVRMTLNPLLVVSQTVPIIAVAPLILIWFGFGPWPKIMIVVLVCFFPIAVSLADGLRQVDRNMVRLLKSMGASRWQIYRMVKIPAALPSLFSGLRIAAAYSVLGSVITEWIAGSRGLGIFLLRSMKSFETARVFAAILLIVVLSLFMYACMEWIARRMMPWHKLTEKKGN